MIAMNGDTFNITGHKGRRVLSGSIQVGGAKNVALKIMAATILFNDSVIIKNVPAIEDVLRMKELLEDLGSKIITKDKNTYEITGSKKSKTKLNKKKSSKMRSSIALIGPLLARFGTVSFPHPGGCVIGERPIDIFLEGFKKMGAIISREGSYYTISSKGKLHGAEIFFKVQSVTGTETFIMAGVLAEGITVIKNAAIEPEVESLVEFLNLCGAKITGAGTSTIKIEGGDILSAKGREYVAIPDRIEAGSFLVLGALLGKDVTIEKCNPVHLEALIHSLQTAGVVMDVKADSIRIEGDKQPKSFSSVNIKTHEYPGFPTDLQAPMTVFLTQTQGESLVFETIFEGRLSYVEALETMGADIVSMDPHRVLIRGPASLHGKQLESPDLRAGLAFILAALVAKGESVIHNVYYIDRGYEDIESRLHNVGANIERIKNNTQQ